MTVRLSRMDKTVTTMSKITSVPLTIYSIQAIIIGNDDEEDNDDGDNTWDDNMVPGTGTRLTFKVYRIR